MTNTNGLRTVKLNLSGKEITVSEATYLMGVERAFAVNEIMEKPRENNVAQNILVNIYTSLKACSDGNVPNPDEFLRMKETDVESWITTARSLNPHWFTFLDEAEKVLSNRVDEKTSKKKERGNRKNLPKVDEVGSG